MVITAANPVLHVANAAPVFLKTGTGQQTAMHLQQTLHRHHAAGLHAVHPPDHRVDVAEHFCGRDIPGVFTQLLRCIGAEQSPSPHLQAFDAGRGDALRAEQEPGQRLTVLASAEAAVSSRTRAVSAAATSAATSPSRTNRRSDNVSGR